MKGRRLRDVEGEVGVSLFCFLFCLRKSFGGYLLLYLALFPLFLVFVCCVFKAFLGFWVFAYGVEKMPFFLGLFFQFFFLDILLVGEPIPFRIVALDCIARACSSPRAETDIGMDDSLHTSLAALFHGFALPLMS
jgi:hypothetical protein